MKEHNQTIIAEQEKNIIRKSVIRFNTGNYFYNYFRPSRNISCFSFLIDPLFYFTFSVFFCYIENVNTLV